MNYILYFLLAFLVGALYRLLRGPLLEDRILALNVVAVIIVVIIGFYSIINDQSFILDIALIYAVLSFAEILAFVKFTSVTTPKEKNT